jgi:phosphodiesterase/alkaline phosphatase D-like protein
MRSWIVVTGALAVLATGSALPSPNPISSFPQGVASGEVRSRSAILWTRTIDSPVRLEVASSAEFAVPVWVRNLVAQSARDGTLSAKVAGLRPGTRYYYRFVALRSGRTSDRGTFVTAPSENADASAHFAFSGDSDGWIDPATGRPAYNEFEVLDRIRAAAAAGRLDFFAYLGDTIYGDSRFSPFGPADTLAEFRLAYRQNRSYRALRELLASVPEVAVWDDHEVRNNFDSSIAPALFAAGRRAFQEYMPVSGWDPEVGFYRRFRWGRSIEFFVLDGRSFRSPALDRTARCDNPPGSGAPDLAPMLPQTLRSSLAGLSPQLELPVPSSCIAALQDPARTLLGWAQKRRFEADLIGSTARFKLVLNDVPIQNLYLFPYDRWEGYLGERAEILEFIRANRIENVVWLTTDTHANITNDIYTDLFTGIDTGMIEMIAGPIAANTFAEEIAELGIPAAALGGLEFFLQAVLGAECAGLDRYAYGDVIYDAGSGRLLLQQIDAQGRGLCPPVMIP